MNQWIIVATVLFHNGAIEELPAARLLDDVEACKEYRTQMLVAYDGMIAREQALADGRCAASEGHERCSDYEFRRAVPWIFLGYPRCNELPTQ